MAVRQWQDYAQLMHLSPSTPGSPHGNSSWCPAPLRPALQCHGALPPLLCAGLRAGLLQQFRMEEEALQRILQHEIRRGALYTWILKTRPDTYWAGPPLPLPGLSRILEQAGAGSAMPDAGPKQGQRRVGGAIVIPLGMDFGGYNDRLAVGPRDAMLVVHSSASPSCHECMTAGSSCARWPEGGPG